MKKHTKVYIDYWNYGEQDFIPCDNCDCQAVDIHHIESRGLGGDKCKDYIENLIALCRICHNTAHSDKNFNKSLKIINLQKILFKLIR